MSTDPSAGDAEAMVAAGGPDEDPLARDPGVQPQRTALAWQRTVLACVAVAVVTSGAWLRLDAPQTALLTGTLVVVPVLLAHRRRVRSHSSPWRPLAALMVALCVLAASGAAAALVALRA